MERAVSASISARVKQCLVFGIQCSVFRDQRRPVARSPLNTEPWSLNPAFAFAAILLAALPLAAQPAVDVFQFLDGSTLHGSLAGIDPEKGIRWKHPAAAAPLEFLPRNAHQIRFAQAATPPALSAAQQTCRFRFVNGDELAGNLLALDATHLELETWFAGKVRAPREGVQSLVFLQRGFVTLYDGPDTLDGWNAGPTSTAWQLRDGVLTASANAFLGRDLKLPAQSRIEFEVGAASALNLYVSLYTDAIARFNFSSAGYQFNLGFGYVNLMRGQGQFGMQHLGQAQIPVPPPGKRMKVEIRSDLAAGSLTLLVEGNVVQQWTDPNPAKPAEPVIDPNLPPTVADAVRDAARARGPVLPGTGLSFFAMNGGIQLTALKVTAWDGRPIEPEITATNLNGHLVRLANQDRAHGRVEAIRDGRLVLAAAAGRLEIPLGRVTQVILSPMATIMTNRPPGETHARLSSGETVALAQPRWDGARLAGVSPHFGPVQFDTRWVRALRFNPDSEPEAPDLPFFGPDARQFFER
jgi:hypothetical protein